MNSIDIVFSKLLPTKKQLHYRNCLVRAGVIGIEPTLAVLETVVLPLYDTPSAPLIISKWLGYLNKNY